MLCWMIFIPSSLIVKSDKRTWKLLVQMFLPNCIRGFEKAGEKSIRMNKLQNGGLSRPQKTGKIRKVKMLRMLFSCFCAFDVSSDVLRTFFYILLFAPLLNLIKQNLNLKTQLFQMNKEKTSPSVRIIKMTSS